MIQPVKNSFIGRCLISHWEGGTGTAPGGTPGVGNGDEGVTCRYVAGKGLNHEFN